MKLLDFLQGLPIPGLLAATVFFGLVLSWAILGLVRFGVRLSGLDPAKPLPIHDLVPVTSILFALMIAFSASGIWNDWQQARSAVQREALALENVLALAEGLSSERATKVKESVIEAAAEQNGRRWRGKPTWTIAIVVSFCIFGFDCARALLAYPAPRTTAAAFNNSRLRIAEDLALMPHSSQVRQGAISAR